MIKINQLKLPVEHSSDDDLKNEICSLLHINSSNLYSYKVLKKSMDARKKPSLFWVYQVSVRIHHETEVLRHLKKNKDIFKYKPEKSFLESICKVNQKKEVAVVGAGPAGLFAAYYLALSGMKPIVIERGSTVDERKKAIEKFWMKGILDPDTNISFGEGGAGTFSDGKLNTGAKDRFGRIRFVLETFVECGADPSILYDAKPHIGTDVLQSVIINLRKRIEGLGGVFHFNTKVVGIEYKGSSLQGLICRSKEKEWTLSTSKCILAIGHSARDTFEYLYDNQIHMEPKSFAVGVRVEHLQSSIDRMQYGKSTRELLPPADYKCTGKGVDDRGVYSFCMCPGGFVVNASSEAEGLVVNGMSNHKRDEVNANSAIVVTVNESDFQAYDTNHPVLAGIAFQRELEHKAYLLAGGKIPVQRFEDFCKQTQTTKYGLVTPNTKGDTMLCNLQSIFPDYLRDSIIMGMRQFGHRMKGFDDPDTLLEGVETRTSSPVRILRDDSLQSSLEGLYPCGEGAGYAGGIMSAAMDGLKVADMLANKVISQED